MSPTTGGALRKCRAKIFGISESMKKKSNHAAKDEFRANLYQKVEAYFETLSATLRYLPNSERAKWLKQENWLENVPDKAFAHAAIKLLLDANAERVQPQDSPVMAKFAAQFFQSSEFRPLTDRLLLEMIHIAVKT